MKLIRTYISLHHDENPGTAMERISQQEGCQIILAEPQGIADQWMFITTPFDIHKHPFVYGGQEEPEASSYGAQAVYEKGLERVKNTREPKGQKFHIGERVFIAKGRMERVNYSKEGAWATVQYTYAHAYGGGNEAAQEYFLNIDNYGPVAWFDEDELSTEK